MTSPGLTDTAEFQPPTEQAARAWRWDLLALLCGAALVVSSAFEGRRLHAAGVNIFLGFPPLLASWMPHFGPGTAPAIATAAAVVIWGPGLAHRLRWRTLR
ncbi:MAG: hypothetical protein M3Z25_18470 [Actinomycetota bacterium]|nr:hypothetical protein [Actinomycetota bacterium]